MPKTIDARLGRLEDLTRRAAWAGAPVVILPDNGRDPIAELPPGPVRIVRATDLDGNLWQRTATLTS